MREGGLPSRACTASRRRRWGRQRKVPWRFAVLIVNMMYMAGLAHTAILSEDPSVGFNGENMPDFLLHSATTEEVHNEQVRPPASSQIDSSGSPDPVVNTEHGVILLTHENFEYVMKEHQTVLLIIYTPQCNHSQLLITQMELAASLLSAWETNERHHALSDIHLPSQLNLMHKSPPRLAKIDVSSELWLSELFMNHVHGYPTLTLIQLATGENSQPDHSRTSQDNTLEDDDGVCFYQEKQPTPNRPDSWYCIKPSNYVFVDYHTKSLHLPQYSSRKSYTSIFHFLMHYWTRTFPSSASSSQSHPEGMIHAQNRQELESTLNFLHRLDFIVRQEHAIHHASSRSNNVSLVDISSVAIVQCRQQSQFCTNTNQTQDNVNNESCEAPPTPMDSFDDYVATISSPNVQQRMTVHYVALYNDCHFIQLRSSGQIRVVITGMKKHQPTYTTRLDYEETLQEQYYFGGFYDPPQRKEVIHPQNEGELDRDDTMEQFISMQSIPLLTWLCDENLPTLFDKLRKVHIALFVDNDPHYLMHSITDLAVDSMMQAALRFRDQDFTFLMVPRSEYRIIEYFAVTSFPSVMITDMRSDVIGMRGMMKFYLASEHISSQASIPEFVHQFALGSLRPVLKSEPISGNDGKGPVKVVRGDTFESMVMKSNRHSLVNFFASWCGHSKSLTPKWHELAEFVEMVDWDIDIMKMEATVNDVDHPHVDIDGFPTIYLFPKGNKTFPVRYESDKLEAKDFVAWLFQHGLANEATPAATEERDS